MINNVVNLQKTNDMAIKKENKIGCELTENMYLCHK